MLVQSHINDGTFNDMSINAAIKKIRKQLSVIPYWQETAVSPDSFDMISASIIALATQIANEYRRSY